MFTDDTICFVDSHAHLQLAPLYDQRETALFNARVSGVHTIVVNGVCPGEDWSLVETLCLESSSNSLQLVPSFGLHPWWIEKLLEKDFDETALISLCDDVSLQLRQKLSELTSACVGECGLDKNVKKRVNIDAQETILRVHVQIAIEYQRPISLHCVGSWGRLYDIVEELNLSFQGENQVNCDKSYPGDSKLRHGVGFCVVLHSCNKIPLNMCTRFLQLSTLSIYYSFNGRQIDNKVAEVLKVIPPEYLLIETDCPDQMPVIGPSPDVDFFAHNDTKKELHDVCNEPANIVSTCQKISHLLDLSCNEVAAITAHNAKRVFATVSTH